MKSAPAGTRAEKVPNLLWYFLGGFEFRALNPKPGFRDLGLWEGRPGIHGDGFGM